MGLTSLAPRGGRSPASASHSARKGGETSMAPHWHFNAPAVGQHDEASSKQNTTREPRRMIRMPSRETCH
eukprot:15448750-Alexandrium_andersonii.AAC.1